MRKKILRKKIFCCKMENDPIETDDPLELCVWHAQERICEIENKMRALKQRYASLARLRNQWQHHRRTLQDAQRSRVDTNEEEDTPTQQCTFD